MLSLFFNISSRVVGILDHFYPNFDGRVFQGHVDGLVGGR